MYIVKVELQMDSSYSVGLLLLEEFVFLDSCIYLFFLGIDDRFQWLMLKQFVPGEFFLQHLGSRR